MPEPMSNFTALPSAASVPQADGLARLEAGQPAQEGPVLAASPNPDTAPQPIPYWLRQLERVMRVLVRLYLGLLVCFAPWYPQAWDNNPLFSQPPSLMHFIAQGWVRGVVSGLGLLNLWIALSEALRPAKDDSSR